MPGGRLRSLLDAGEGSIAPGAGAAPAPEYAVSRIGFINEWPLHLGWVLVVPILIVIVWLWADYKRVIYKNFGNKLRVPVETYHELYFWTIQYHCISRFCLQAQLPRAEKLLDWCDSRRRNHVEGIPVPNIVLKTYRSALFLAPSGIIGSVIILHVLLNIECGRFMVNDKEVFRIMFLFLLALIGALLFVLGFVTMRLELAAVQWVMTTALHALSPVELAFGIATGIRLHTYEQAMVGKGPDASEEWGDMSGSGQEDGIKMYARHFTGLTDPFAGMGSLYPGDIPIKVFSTALTVLLTYLAVCRAKPGSDTTTALLGVGLLILGASALVIQMILNLASAAKKLRRGTEQVYRAASLAYWSPRLPSFETYQKLTLPKLVGALTKRNSGDPGFLAASESNLDEGKLTEADWCQVTGKEVSFEQFADAYFPPLWSMLLPIQRLDLKKLAKLDAVVEPVEYPYSPTVTLESLLKEIKRKAETWTAAKATPGEPQKSGSPDHTYNVLRIGKDKCGQRKMLISNNGKFSPESSLGKLKSAVVNDLYQLAVDVEQTAGIHRSYSIQWWLAQPTFDQFVGTVSIYRTLTADEEKSYAPGIRATLRLLGRGQHRLQRVKHEVQLKLDDLNIPEKDAASLKAWLRHYWEFLRPSCGQVSLVVLFHPCHSL
jgi:hypothetical protein